MGLTDLQVVLSVLAGLVALLVLVALVRNRQPGNLELAGLLLLELGLLVQVVWAVVDLARGALHPNVAVYLAYLVGGLLILPIGFVWSASERSRGGTGVLLVAVLVVPVLFLRLHDLAAVHG